MHPEQRRGIVPPQLLLHPDLAIEEGRETPMEPTGRMFLCDRCRVQVIICSRCDRGQRYCTGNCADDARRASLRAAGRRYQCSRRGRLTHAERSRRYRRRQQNVTHQVSMPPAQRDLLAVNSAVGREPAAVGSSAPSRTFLRDALFGLAQAGLSGQLPGSIRCPT